MRLDEFLARLEGVRHMRDGVYAARCPGHEDRVGSLVVSDGDDRILLKCHAGCSVAEIIECRGLALGDLFYGAVTRDNGRVSLSGVQPARTSTSSSSTSRAARDCAPAGGSVLDEATVAAWRRELTDEMVERLTELKGWSLRTVRQLGLCLVPGPAPEHARLGLMNYDAGGGLIGYVRYQPNKGMLAGSYPKCLAVGPRALWPGPELLGDGSVTGSTWLVEGEPDRVSGVELGLECVGAPGVAVWKDGWSERFRGRRVVVCFDCDEPGRSAMANRVYGLREAGVSAVGVDLWPGRGDGWDIGDMLSAAHGEGRVDELRRWLVNLELGAWMRAAA